MKNRKIDLALAAVWKLIATMLRENLDRACIASFGNSFRIEQDFTSSKSQLRGSLEGLGRSVVSGNEGTRQYDSMADAVTAFWKSGRRNVPWIWITIGDGQDGCSKQFPTGEPNSAALLGRYIAQTFSNEPSNFPVLIGVGKGNQIDAKAIETIGRFGNFACADAIENFALLEALFLKLAVQITTELTGHTYSLGNRTWHEISGVRERLSHTPIDVLFLIDRSGSMKQEEGIVTPTGSQVNGSGSSAHLNRVSLN